MKYCKIYKAAEKKEKNELARNLALVKSAADVKNNLNGCGLFNAAGECFRGVGARLIERQEKKPLAERRKIIIERMQKESTKKLEKLRAYLEKIEQAIEPQTVRLVINWTRGRVWGWCPQCEIWAGSFYAKTRRVGGCGYDKKSTATADALQGCAGLSKIILEKLEKLASKKIFEIVGAYYGARNWLEYGISLNGGRVEWSGGVGFSCHDKILRNLGFDCVASWDGKAENYYLYERKSNRGKK